MSYPVNSIKNHVCGVPPRLAYGLRSSAFVGTWNGGAARPAIRDRVRRLLEAQATREIAGSVERGRLPYLTAGALLHCERGCLNSGLMSRKISL